MIILVCVCVFVIDFIQVVLGFHMLVFQPVRSRVPPGEPEFLQGRQCSDQSSWKQDHGVRSEEVSE